VWAPQTIGDRFVVSLYRVTSSGARATVVLIALLIFGLEAFAVWGALQSQPILAVFFIVSVVPAAAVAWYIWTRDAKPEPFRVLVLTVALGVLFATFAGVTNAFGSAVVTSLVPSFEEASPIVALAAIGGFFFLVVGLGEEVVKWLAVRLYSYRSESFSSPIDGAVYGAMAGLGFAIIENVLYVTQFTSGTVGIEFVASAIGVTTTRAFVGPNHVLWTAIAGYYLGLAKFNPEFRGPLLIKGVGTAAILHGLYNTTAGIVPGIVASVLGLGVASILVQLAYVVLFATFVGLYLFRIIRRYGRSSNVRGQVPPRRAV
jgi:RsiW-degrading membrane proteinase PrsW (M82 family)